MKKRMIRKIKEQIGEIWGKWGKKYRIILYCPSGVASCEFGYAPALENPVKIMIRPPWGKLEHLNILGIYDIPLASLNISATLTPVA